jgi:predicted flap endonuclease-1-like 5' DNA nuclease
LPQRARVPRTSDQRHRQLPPAPASVANDSADDLGRIEGVEPWIADLLRSCGIEQFTALAGHSAETLATALRERAFGELTSERIKRENWLDQARRLSGGADPLPESDTTEPGNGPSTERTGQPGRQQAGGFSLFFDAIRDEKGNEAWQTRVYHEESGQEVILPGTEAGPWASWILSRALPEAGRRGEQPGGTFAGPSLVHHLTVRIIGARLAKDGRAEGASECFSVEVRLQVSGLLEIEQALGSAALAAVLGRDR